MNVILMRSCRNVFWRYSVTGSPARPPLRLNTTARLRELHVPQNWLCNFVKRQKRKCFGYIQKNDGLDTLLEVIVTRTRSRDKPPLRYEKDATDGFGKLTAAGRIAGERHRFCKKIWAAMSSPVFGQRCRHQYLGSDVVTSIWAAMSSPVFGQRCRHQYLGSDVVTSIHELKKKMGSNVHCLYRPKPIIFLIGFCLSCPQVLVEVTIYHIRATKFVPQMFYF